MTVISYLLFSNIMLCSMLSVTNQSGPLYAHNDSNISIPIAKHRIGLDGKIDQQEWIDAFKVNFSSPRYEGTVLVYLKYELTEKSLSGAFLIPDKTQVNDSKNPDQIAFLFDVVHSALNITGSDIHDIIFIRNGVSEYYKGIDKTSSSNSVQAESLVLVNNATMQGIGNANYSSVSLESPFAKADYSVTSNGEKWQGEFKIYFQKSPELMGFSISQVDSQLTPKNTTDTFFINFPKNTTQADIPSSWGDISFFELGRYVEYINDFCPNSRPAISSDNVVILCSSLNLPSVEENNEEDAFIVTGTLANLINGTGIDDYVNIRVRDSRGIQMLNTITIETTSQENGTFESPAVETAGLDSGTYKITVEPKAQGYQALASTLDLIVNPHIPTLEETVTQLGAYIGVAATIIGVIAFLPQLRNYFAGKKQRSNMARQMDELNDIFDTVYSRDASRWDSEQAAHNLIKKRDKVLTMFEHNQINQEHYSLLSSKISEYIDKLLNDRAA
jgi:hypothetical protein